MEAIIYLVGNLFRLYVISRLFCIFLSAEHELIAKKNSFKFKLSLSYIRRGAFFIYYMISSLGFLVFSWPPEIIIVTNLVGMALISLTYEGNLQQRVLAIVMAMSLSIICEDLVVYILVKIGTTHIVTIGITVANMLFFLIVILIEKFVELKEGNKIAITEWLAVSTVPTLTILISAAVLDKCVEASAVLLGEICLILMNLLVFFLISRIQDAYRKKTEMQLVLQENKADEKQICILQKSEEQISSLRHDIKNHLVAIREMAEQKECEKLQNYIGNIYGEIKPTEKWISTGNSLIDGVINLKLSDAADAGEKIETDVCIPQDLQINPRDIVAILGNLLDNAIRALYEEKEPKKLIIRMSVACGLLHIQVINTYREDTARCKNNGRKLEITSKRYTNRYAKHHGIGLKNVSETVAQHYGQMTISTEEETFCVTIDMFIDAYEDVTC